MRVLLRPTSLYRGSTVHAYLFCFVSLPPIPIYLPVGAQVLLL